MAALPDPAAFLYYYRAKCTRVVDGDTVDIDLDYGFRLYQIPMRIRLFGINTPEIHSPDLAQRALAVIAKARVETAILGKQIVVRTEKDTQEKYGRWLGTIFYAAPDGTWTNLNVELVAAGLATRM